MHYEIQPNLRHESDARTAFLEQLAAYKPSRVTVVVNRSDLIEPDKQPSLENIAIPKHHMQWIDEIVFQEDATAPQKFIYRRK